MRICKCNFSCIYWSNVTEVTFPFQVTIFFQRLFLCNLWKALLIPHCLAPPLFRNMACSYIIHWSGLDWLIGSTEKTPCWSVWLLCHECQCSVMALGIISLCTEIYLWCWARAACTCSPLTECCLVDDIIMFWLT